MMPLVIVIMAPVPKEHQYHTCGCTSCLDNDLASILPAVHHSSCCFLPYSYCAAELQLVFLYRFPFFAKPDLHNPSPSFLSSRFPYSASHCRAAARIPLPLPVREPDLHLHGEVLPVLNRARCANSLGWGSSRFPCYLPPFARRCWPCARHPWSSPAPALAHRQMQQQQQRLLLQRQRQLLQAHPQRQQGQQDRPAVVAEAEVQRLPLRRRCRRQLPLPRRRCSHLSC